MSFLNHDSQAAVVRSYGCFLYSVFILQNLRFLWDSVSVVIPLMNDSWFVCSLFHSLFEMWSLLGSWWWLYVLIMLRQICLWVVKDFIFLLREIFSHKFNSQQRTDNLLRTNCIFWVLYLITRDFFRSLLDSI